MRDRNSEGARVPGHARPGTDLLYARGRKNSMTCEETKILLADYLSQSMGEAQELTFDAHLATCDACRAEAGRLRALWTSLGLLPFEEPSANLSSRFYETLAAYRHGLESVPQRSWRE